MHYCLSIVVSIKVLGADKKTKKKKKKKKEEKKKKHEETK